MRKQRPEVGVCRYDNLVVARRVFEYLQVTRSLHAKGADVNG
jgi:hypothetical protein